MRVSQRETDGARPVCTCRVLAPSNRFEVGVCVWTGRRKKKKK